MICCGRDDRVGEIVTSPTQTKIGLEWATTIMGQTQSEFKNAIRSAFSWGVKPILKRTS